jgi:glutamyl-tRNA synthetase
MKSDLRWLGLDWDEGPDPPADPASAPHGPYRQSERAAIYQSLVSRLVREGKAYPCFCTDAELEVMKADAEAKKLAPIYRGRWASATKEEVEAELAKGTPCCYRFRVPAAREVAIDDAVRGRVAWSTDTLGDFVVLRSNGLPVYNFCVAVDDALMRVTDVLRAEEHLPNTLRQVLVYEALGWPSPRFAHMSLILAPDRSKLSKRHGATSVGEFRAQGYLPGAMVNYLALLGWNDGTEQELFLSAPLSELSARFSVERITKSPAVFDRAKLSWMNGQHLRGMPEGELRDALVAAMSGGEGSGGDAVLAPGCDAAFSAAAAALVAGSVDVLTEAAPQVRAILDYPLERTAADEGDKAFAAVRGDAFGEVVRAVLAAADAGELAAAAQAGASGDGGEAYKAWAKGLGKATGRKGKRLFMPLRVALTGRTQGPDVGDVVAALSRCDPARDLAAGVPFASLQQRVEALRAWAGKEGLLEG